MQDDRIDSLYSRLEFNKIIAFAFSLLNGANTRANRNLLAYAILPIVPSLTKE